MPSTSCRNTAVPKFLFFSIFRSTMGSGCRHSQKAKKMSVIDGKKRCQLNLPGAKPVLLLALIERELE